jgi:hypothetical protein
MHVGAAQTINLFGNDEQKERWLKAKNGFARHLFDQRASLWRPLAVQFFRSRTRWREVGARVRKTPDTRAPANLFR